MRYYEQLLSGYSKLGKRVNDLSRIGTLLNALGDPQKKLRFVHIAGTNGKGSCAQMTADTLKSAGYKTGLFTSPYILRYNDRIRINGVDISDDELDDAARAVGDAVKQLHGCGFSQFEITQAIAFEYFAKEKCGIVVLEAGLGGKLDSTNVIDPPIISLICSVSFDHTAILGDTIEQIAEQKAGIIKRGSKAVILAPQNPPQAERIVADHAKRCGCRLIIPDISRMRTIKCTPFGCGFEYLGKVYSTAMGGYHQIKNALCAIECAKALTREGFAISDNDIASGLSAMIPARLQILSRDPLIILDGGHNPDAVGALADALKAIDAPIKMVAGMLSDKDSRAAAALIANCAKEIICVGDFYPNARSASELAEIFAAALSSEGTVVTASQLSAQETVRQAAASLKKGEVLVIFGSLYLASLFSDGELVRKALPNGRG